ncbi:MAG: thioredoxin family protein [Thermaurantimonas sp.]|uniref:thioredoxin family protein n=1 Tax=Thermaurantimonas sp. TaxID=2681568 RepID=UPI00391D2834
MKHSFFFLYLVGFQIFSQGIRFESGTFAEALVKAKNEGKLVFVDAYTTWCGPCKWLAREVFPDSELGKFYNENFVSLQIDMEKGEGIDFAKKYNVQAYPTLLYFDAEGNEIHRLLGAREAFRLLKETKELMNEDNRFSTIKKLIESSEQVDKNILRKYLVLLNEQGESDEKRLRQYLDLMTPEDWKDIDILSVLLDYSGRTEDCSDPYTKGIFDNYNTVITALAMYPDYQRSLKEFFYVKLAKSFARKIDDKKYDNSVAERFLKSNENVFVRDRVMLTAQRYAEKNKNNHKKLLEIDNILYEKYIENADQLNNAAWEIYENPDASKKELKYALSWARKSVQIREEFYNTDTLAHLLYRLGYWQEARQWAERSVALGREAGEDVTLTEILLLKIQNAGK